MIPTIGRDTLPIALDSLKSQTDPDWKAIVVTDGPVELDKDPDPRISYVESPRTKSAGLTRNFGVRKVDTSWVAFLDDDDFLTEDYVECFKREAYGDVVIFRMDHPTLGFVPRIPAIELGNVGISFAVKTEWMKRIPFIKERVEEAHHEDYLLIKAMDEAGAKIHWSTKVTYLVGEDK